MKIKKSVIFLFVILVILITLNIITNLYLPKPDTDLKGELAQSKQQDLSILVLPPVPILTIISPENITYSSATILLNYSELRAETLWYNIDARENITITAPLSFSISEGTHTLYLYANNTEGITTESITFSVHIPTQPPENGGGNGGGGGGDEITNDTEGGGCQESWVCKPWAECSDFSQQRTCTDTSHCNETYSKIEERDCSPEGPEVPRPEEPRKPFLFWVILILVLIAIIIIIIIKRRKIKGLIKKLYKNKKRKKSVKK